MTEDKRFTLAYEKGRWWAVRDGDITLWKEEVIYLLNALYKENRQLKKESKELKHRIKKLERTTFNTYKDYVQYSKIF